MLKYTLNKAILAEDPQNPIYSAAYHKFIKLAYDEIVIPMTDKLIDTMIFFKILNEGELFCTTLTFNLEDENNGNLIGDKTLKDEDAVKALNKKLDEIIRTYKSVFERLCDQEKINKHTLARALYFATYYNRENYPYNSYLSQFWMCGDKELETIVDFGGYWLDKRDERGFEQEYWDKLQDYSYYKKVLKKGKMKSNEKLIKILRHKQFFSIPWLVCYPHLFLN